MKKKIGKVNLKKIPITDYSVVHSCKKPCSLEKKGIGDCMCHNMNWSKGENLSSRVVPFAENSSS
jgi:hypothetical protein